MDGTGQEGLSWAVGGLAGEFNSLDRQYFQLWQKVMQVLCK